MRGNQGYLTIDIGMHLQAIAALSNTRPHIEAAGSRFHTLARLETLIPFTLNTAAKWLPFKSPVHALGTSNWCMTS